MAEVPAVPFLACVDVDYRNTGAQAAAAWFRGWHAAAAEREATRWFDEVEPYVPGEFFRRELPCLLGVLERGPAPEIVVVDGYVWLGAGVPGMGAHLHAALGGGTTVVGVAKTRFAGANEAVEVRRGGSQAPLFVTAAGMSAAAAAAGVAAMLGPYRMPTLLKRVDTLARGATAGAEKSGFPCRKPRP